MDQERRRTVGPTWPAITWAEPAIEA